MPISTGSVELGTSPAPMQNGKAATIHHRMAFSLRFEENAERRQRLRLAQQSRKLRARNTDVSPHHPGPVTINSPASPQWLQAPMPSSRTNDNRPACRPPSHRHPRSHNQPIVLAFLAVVPWNPKKYCRCVSLDISIGYSSAVATAGTAWNGTRLWL